MADQDAVIDARRSFDRVTVHAVVGLTVTVGSRIACDAGVVLALEDADGPPLRALVWPGEAVITSQSPAPETTLFRWDSVIVTFAQVDASAGVREPRRPQPRPSSLHASRATEQHADDAGDQERGPRDGEGVGSDPPSFFGTAQRPWCAGSRPPAMGSPRSGSITSWLTSGSATTASLGRA